MNVFRPNNRNRVFLALLPIFSLVVAMFPVANAVASKENKTSESNLSFANSKQKVTPQSISTESLPKNLQVTGVSVSSNGRNGKVLVAWADGGAKLSLGFNVYRQAGGRYTLLNPAPVAGAAYSFEPRVNEPVGGHFAWWDDARSSGGYQPVYWIEYVGLDGQSSWHGPFGIEGKIGNVEITRSRLLTELINVDSTTQQDILPRADFTAERVNLKDDRAFQESVSSQSMQWQLAAGTAAKVIVDQNGIARVPRSALEAAGITFTNPNTIKVFDAGQEIAVTLTPAGDLELYGQNLDIPTTNKRVYWVANINDSVNGKRIQQINAGPFDNGVQPAFFTSTIERKDRIIRSSNILNGDADNFYGSLILSNSAIGAPPTLQSMFVHGLNQSASEQAVLTIGVQGSQTPQAHNISVKLNGTDIGSITFNDRENTVKQFQVAHTLLREGKNTVSLTNVSLPDSSMVDFVRLSYSRQYKALSNRLRFTTQNSQAVRVNGFTSSQIKVLDITDPQNPKEMVVAPQANGDGTFSFTLPAGTARNFLAESSNAAQYQPSTVANETSTLNSATNNANFVIITHNKFKQLLTPLVTLRQGQGLTPKIVDVEDVYDEFDFSKHGPLAIKNFLNHAKQTWQTPPQYVLMMGDATYDPKDYIASGGFNADLVPTKLVDSLFSETASDDWLVDSNDDGVPELSIGRISARTEAEANIILSKITGYDGQPAGFTLQNGAVMVSDSFDGSYDFEAFTADVRTSLPAQLNVTFVNRSQADTATVRGLIISNINSGKGIVNFLGHGTLSAWTSANLFTANDAVASTNAPKHSLLIALTCLNGLFIEPAVNSLAENAHKAPNGGAVAVWASSGLTFPFGQVAISKSFYSQFFGVNPPRIGDAVRLSKSATTDMDVRRLTVFFGDPTMRLR